jgi:uncharacterized membrane protein
MSRIEESIEVNVPVSVAYNRWTQFEEFPKFMDGVKEVKRLDATHLHWVVEVGGKVNEWDAEIIEERPDERVAWKSTSGKENAGVVTFQRLGANRCKVSVDMGFETEGLVETLGSALGSDSRQVKTDLERFKEMIEDRTSSRYTESIEADRMVRQG